MVEAGSPNALDPAASEDAGIEDARIQDAGARRRRKVGERTEGDML